MACFNNLWELPKTKLQQLSNTRSNKFQDLLFSNIISTKIDYYSRKIFENKVVNSIWKN